MECTYTFRIVVRARGGRGGEYTICHYTIGFLPYGVYDIPLKGSADDQSSSSSDTSVMIEQ
jgi:hypothetical protein